MVEAVRRIDGDLDLTSEKLPGGVLAGMGKFRL
jgi:hypothetical protein